MRRQDALEELRARQEGYNGAAKQWNDMCRSFRDHRRQQAE